MIFLPPYLLFLVASYPPLSPALKLPWSRNGDLFSRLTAEGNNIGRRNAAGLSELAASQLIGVRKMTLDEGEMFFPEYWNPLPNSQSDFALRRTILVPQEEHDTKQVEDEGESEDWANATLFPPVQAPFALHAMHDPQSQSPLTRFLHLPRGLFAASKRDYICPGGTSPCTNVNSSTTCCATGQTCQSIGSGLVGCCVDGQTCSQEVTPCEESYASCSDSPGGGCCVPGYSCVAEGCQVQSTATVIINPTITASLTSSSTSSSSSVVDASTSVSTSTHTDTTSTTSTVTDSPSSTRSSTSSSSTSSPASSSSTSSKEAPTPIPVAPIRPISGTASTSTTTTAPPTTITPSQCPTGFYACSAYYHGGCCRVGRDCSETSCPAASSTVALNSDGVSVGVPAATTGAALGEGGCALGWFACGMGVGGGCCPSGYSCGESCIATGVNIGGGVTGTAKVAKDNGIGRLIVNKALLMIYMTSMMPVFIMIA